MSRLYLVTVSLTPVTYNFLLVYLLSFVCATSPANFDVLHQPRNISEISKKNVCFYMFVDEKTEAFIKKARRIDRKAKKIGLWRLVIVKNLPYDDARRTGKVHSSSNFLFAIFLRGTFFFRLLIELIIMAL